MMNGWIKYMVMFTVVVLAQVLVFNQIHMGGYLNPYIYVLFILLPPVSMLPYQVLLLSFLVGITVDWFSNTLGLHAAASVLLGFLRLPVINLITQRDAEKVNYPGLQQTGWRRFLLYTSILVVIHHFFLFFTEVFSFAGFFRTVLRSMASSVLTITILVISQLLVFRE